LIFLTLARCFNITSIEDIALGSTIIKYQINANETFQNVKIIEPDGGEVTVLAFPLPKYKQESKFSLINVRGSKRGRLLLFVNSVKFTKDRLKLCVSTRDLTVDREVEITCASLIREG